METESWCEVAFSHEQIEDFLKIAALPYSDAMILFQGRSPQLRCYGVGFYFFANSIKKELAPQLAEELHTLACRVEQCCMHSTLGDWEQNASDAARILATYFRPSEELPAGS